MRKRACFHHRQLQLYLTRQGDNLNALLPSVFCPYEAIGSDDIFIPSLTSRAAGNWKSGALGHFIKHALYTTYYKCGNDSGAKFSDRCGLRAHVQSCALQLLCPLAGRGQTTAILSRCALSYQTFDAEDFRL